MGFNSGFKGLSIEINKVNGKLEVTIDKSPLTVTRYCRSVSLEGQTKTRETSC